MVTNEWSISQELCKLAEASSEAEALSRLGLISDSSTEYLIIGDEDWSRGGTETYIYRFWLHVPEKPTAGYIIKACVSSNFTQTLDETIRDWTARRALLVKNSVNVPVLIYSGHALVIEELIPWNFREHVVTNPLLNVRALDLLTSYTAVLARLGFAPIECYSDLMSRGNDLVAVDFGEDLGPPGMVFGERRDLWEDLVAIAVELKLIESGRFPVEVYQRFVALRDL